MGKIQWTARGKIYGGAKLIKNWLQLYQYNAKIILIVYVLYSGCWTLGLTSTGAAMAISSRVMIRRAAGEITKPMRLV
jgi:hypothetical protein